MSHRRHSARARTRGKPRPSSALTKLTGVAILLIAAIASPMAALAADPTVETQQDPAVVYMVLIVLIAALMTGIFFVSPIRARVIPSTTVPQRPSRLVTPAAMEAEGPSSETQTQPQVPVNGDSAPWSTTGPQQSGPWSHGRPGSRDG